MSRLFQEWQISGWHFSWWIHSSCWQWSKSHSQGVDKQGNSAAARGSEAIWWQLESGPLSLILNPCGLWHPVYWHIKIGVVYGLKRNNSMLPITSWATVLTVKQSSDDAKDFSDSFYRVSVFVIQTWELTYSERKSYYWLAVPASSLTNLDVISSL